MIEQEHTNDNHSRFQFVKELGRGVLGEAYEVIDEVRSEHVVLKVFLRSRPRNLAEFRLEFQSLSRLTHSNLAKYHHLVDPASDTHEVLQDRIGTQGLAITEEFVDGYDLLSYLKLPPTPDEIDRLDQRKQTTGEVPSSELAPEPSTQVMTDADLGIDEYAEYGHMGVWRDPMATAEVQGDAGATQAILEEFTTPRAIDTDLDLVLMRLERVVPQIIAGLDHLHRFHKVHASLRPSNIRVTRSGQVRLTDFGIVQHLVYVPEKAPQKAIPLVLTPENIPFLAPEILEGDVSPASDAYALGCVLFEAVAGQSPYERMEWTEGDRPTLAPPPLADCMKDCPASWANVVDGLLSRNPADRPSLRRVLEVVSGDEARPVLIPATIVEEPSTFVGRREILERIKEFALQTAADYAMQYVQLEGEVGVGKSNLLKALAHWLGRRGWLILKGRFFDPERRPFQGWEGVITAIAEILETLPAGVYDALQDDIDAASCMFPGLGGRPLGEAAPGRLTAIAGFRNILERLGDERPILLVLHDLQWSSWDSASLLLELLAERRLRCLIVGTWQQESLRVSDHLLKSDLTLTLFQVQRIAARGYDAREAEDFARISGGLLKPAAAQARLNRTFLNPLLLRELRHESKDINEALDALLSQIPEENPSTTTLLNRLYLNRMNDLTAPEHAILDTLAIFSAPLPHTTLCHVVEQEVSSKVTPMQSNESAIEESLSHLVVLRLVRDLGDARYVLSQVPINQLVSEALDPRDRARIAGRIADEMRHDESSADEIFVFRKESGRIAEAVDAAISAAEAAEARYAYHRAARIWRWLLENEKSIPDWTMLRPTAELARVEQLAGRHAMAAELLGSSLARIEDPIERAGTRIREMSAWLQASKPGEAFSTLRQAMKELGFSYETSPIERVTLLPHRIFSDSAFGAFRGQRKPEVGVATARQRSRCEILYFAIDWNNWFDPRQTELLEARLSREAEESGDAVLLGMARLKAAETYAAGGLPNHRERCLEWIEDARLFFELAGESEWIAQVHVHEGLVRMWYDEFGAALKAFEKAEALGDEVETHEVYDHRRLLYLRGWTQIRCGALDVAEHEARHILHTYRNDGIGRVFAYRLLAELALLRGDTDRAERVIDGMFAAVKGADGSRIQLDCYRLRARLDIARGRPEVAVGQLDVVLNSPEGGRWLAFGPTRLQLLLTLGQALAAEATREKALNETLLDTTLARLKDVCRKLEKLTTNVEPRIASEIYRLLARYELLRGQFKRALKYADRAILAVGGGTDPLSAARCAEVRGIVLHRLDKPEGKLSVEQAWAVYEIQHAKFPLVLEGWQVPKAISALHDD